MLTDNPRLLLTPSQPPPVARNLKGQFAPGASGNPKGRPTKAKLAAKRAATDRRAELKRIASYEGLAPHYFVRLARVVYGKSWQGLLAADLGMSRIRWSKAITEFRTKKRCASSPSAYGVPALPIRWSGQCTQCRRRAGAARTRAHPPSPTADATRAAAEGLLTNEPSVMFSRNPFAEAPKGVARKAGRHLFEKQARRHESFDYSACGARPLSRGGTLCHVDEGGQAAVRQPPIDVRSAPESGGKDRVIGRQLVDS